MQNQNYLNYLRRKKEAAEKEEKEKKSGNGFLYFIIVVLVGVLGYVLLFPDETSELGPTESTGTSTEEVVNKEEEGEPESADNDREGTVREQSPADVVSAPEPPTVTVPASTHKTFNITAENYEYNISRMSVTLGDTVTINLESLEDWQDIWIEDYRIELDGVKPGRPGTITFVADEVGVFKFYSKVGNNRQQGMEGLFVVTY